MAESGDFLKSNINRLMMDKSEWFKERMKEEMSDDVDALTPAEGMIFGTLRGRKLTVSELARLRGVSRQAIHRTVSGLVGRGLMRLEPAENNERDKVVVVTEAGQRKRDQVAELLACLEGEIAQVIGKDRLELLREILMEDWSQKSVS